MLKQLETEHLSSESQEIIKATQLDIVNFGHEEEFTNATIDLLEQVIDKAKTDRSYREKLELWLSEDKRFSTVFLRDELILPLGDPSPAAGHASEYSLFNLWVTLDSAHHHVIFDMSEGSSPSPS